MVSTRKKKKSGQQVKQANHFFEGTKKVNQERERTIRHVLETDITEHRISRKI